MWWGSARDVKPWRAAVAILAPFWLFWNCQLSSNLAESCEGYLHEGKSICMLRMVSDWIRVRWLDYQRQVEE